MTFPVLIHIKNEGQSFISVHCWNKKRSQRIFLTVSSRKVECKDRLLQVKLNPAKCTEAYSNLILCLTDKRCSKKISVALKISIDDRALHLAPASSRRISECTEFFSNKKQRTTVSWHELEDQRGSGAEFLAFMRNTKSPCINNYRGHVQSRNVPDMTRLACK